jgi:hypothetical protein
MFARTLHCPFPRIDNPEATRLPRGASYTMERDSGRCLIAIRRQSNRSRPPKKAWVHVRNCYVRAENDVIVENGRHLLTRRTKGDGVVLERLIAGGYCVHRGPFMLEEPMPNCLVDISVKKFDELWETHRTDAPVGSPTPAINDTPMRRLLELHWREHGVNNLWQFERFMRLCRAWGMTPIEMAELIQWDLASMKHFLRGAASTPAGWRLPGPVAVWFYFLENFRLGISVFPSLPEQRKAS